MRSQIEPHIWVTHFDEMRRLYGGDLSHPCNIANSILHNRRFVLACNYAYEVIGESCSDRIYEYSVESLEVLRKYARDEWDACDYYSNYFNQDEWTYTGQGSPFDAQIVLWAQRLANGIAPFTGEVVDKPRFSKTVNKRKK